MHRFPEDQLKILKMIEAQTISADEGAALLQGMAHNDTQTANNHEADEAARWLRVQITDTRDGSACVQVNIPIGLIDVSLRMGARFVPTLDEAAYAELIEQTQKCPPGTTFEFFDEARSEKIELTVE